MVIYHAPKAHTDGDVMVLFRSSDVIATGDVFRTDSYPHIDPERGGSLQGVLAGLNNVLDITVPERNQMGGTASSRPRPHLQQADVLEYRDMLTIIRDRVREMVKKNMTLDQVRRQAGPRIRRPVWQAGRLDGREVPGACLQGAGGRGGEQAGVHYSGEEALERFALACSAGLQSCCLENSGDGTNASSIGIGGRGAVKGAAALGVKLGAQAPQGQAPQPPGLRGPLRRRI